MTPLGVMGRQVNPAGTMSVRDTAPENPLTAVMVMLEVAETPTGVAAGVDATIVKS